MHDYIIETNDLVKVYGITKAVDHVSMHVPSGSIYGFVGENGSGKTTIMRLLTGLATPNNGTYSLFGIDYKDRNVYEVRKDISAIVEAISIVPSFTAFENLKMASLYYGVTPQKNYDELLKRVGLEGVGKKKAKNFSLGMKQRLGIAILLLNNPKLMFLDEPMNGLDPSGIASLRELIIDLNHQGITFVISSHILSELEKVATHYGFISHGRMLKEISSTDLANECKKGIELRYSDIDLLVSKLKQIGIENIQLLPNGVKVLDDIKLLDLLTKLKDEGIEINDVKTIDENVEDYYLHLVRNGGIK